MRGKRSPSWAAGLLVAALVTGCLPSSGPRAGGPILDGGGVGAVLGDSRLESTYSWTIENLAQAGHVRLALLSARFRHIDPGLEVVGFRSIDHSHIADMLFPGDPAVRLPVGTLGPIGNVTLDLAKDNWELLVTLRTHRVGLLKASDLLVTYRAHGTTYVRELRDDSIGFEVTGPGTDVREKDPIIMQGDAPR